MTRGKVAVLISALILGLLGSPYVISILGESVKSPLVEGTQVIEEMNAFRAVFVTVPNIEVAKKIAHGLVTKKLAACVNIIPQVISVYEWEGKINEDQELLLMIKSQENLFSELEQFVKENHPYDVPEVIALPIQQGSQAYLDWISKVTSVKNN